jgi:hypothetical protein
VTGSYEHGNNGEEFLGHLTDNYFPQNAASFHFVVSNFPICRMKCEGSGRSQWQFS